MKSAHGLIFIYLGLALVRASEARGEVRYADAFRLASEKTETLGLAGARLDQATEQLKQARAGLLPHIAGEADFFRQDAPTSTVIGNALSEQSTLKLTANQSVFRGFREYAGLRLTKANLRGEEAQLEAARAALHAEVADSFFAAMSAEQDQLELGKLRELTQKRVGSLRERTRIGRSRLSEVLTAETQLASVEAQLEAAQAAVEQARGRLAIVAAVPRAETLVDELALPDALGPVEEFLGRALTGPAMTALREAEVSANEGVKIARGAHLPSVDLSGNYYLRKTGFSNQSKWDFNLGLSMPIFQGGALQSEVREAAAIRREAELRLGQGLRTTDADVRSRYALLSSLMNQIRSLGKARELAERNYQQQARDYAFGLSNNLEVLQALTASVDVRRSEARAKFSAKAAWIALRAAAGTAGEFVR